MTPTNTKLLRDDVLKIREDLRAGIITNAVARTLLAGAKIAIDTMKVEAAVATLGTDLKTVEFDTTPRLRQVA